MGEELRELQGKLGDYNTLVDRLHVDAELDDIKNLSAQIHEKNISENKSLDDVFSTRQRREIEVRELEKAIAQEHKKRDALVQNMVYMFLITAR